MIFGNSQIPVLYTTYHIPYILDQILYMYIYIYIYNTIYLLGAPDCWKLPLEQPTSRTRLQHDDAKRLVAARDNDGIARLEKSLIRSSYSNQFRFLASFLGLG